MINFALLGTGRIGKLHASIINAHPEASLKYVYDIDTSSAKKIAKNYSCEVAKTAKDAISSDQINAILIASATPTHTDYIAQVWIPQQRLLCRKILREFCQKEQH